ncbi:hypothetical protein DI09_9p250 [Mitosporidium daphniae]|uniref:Uncharacterized protein n=1 Tax=Mitosporidium daphniae TaxID=1485682 RepID=A0A098VLH3_9MICR|nr:uncharacterized protein DI09_9p250 [Mitosporidium daphniae]KGG49942.1 hypothetical protein DI09_9p250 [Mitosporidium daphniae]|eukprot:XP_013236369.1 uncharacterized protein DI09_9p250 [Mitosporidium daphniae]
MDGTFSVQSFAITNAIDHEGQKIYTPGSQHFFRKLGVLKISINSQSTQDVQPETTNNKKETDRNEDPPVLCENIKLQLVLWGTKRLTGQFIANDRNRGFEKSPPER